MLVWKVAARLPSRLLGTSDIIAAQLRAIAIHAKATLRICQTSWFLWDGTDLLNMLVA